MKMKKNIQSVYPKKYREEKHVDLLLKEKEGKMHYIVIKDSNTFMYDHTSYDRKKTLLFLLFTGF